VIVALKDNLVYGTPFLPAPRAVAIGPAYQCNFRCLFCIEHSSLEFQPGYHYQKEKRGYLQSLLGLSLFKKTIDDLFDIGVRFIMLCDGGEPFLHPDIFTMIEYVKSKGMKCWIASNGSVLDEGKIRRLVEIKLDLLHISLNAASPSVHARVHGTGNQNYFDAIVANVESLHRYKELLGAKTPVLYINNVITKSNYLEVKEMIRLGARLHATTVAFETFFYCKGRESLLKDIILSAEDRHALQQLLLEASLEAHKLRLCNNINQILLRLRTQAQLTFQIQNPLIYRCDMQANGDVYPYFFPTRMGNVTQHSSFCEIWYSVPFIRFRRRLQRMARHKQTYEGYPYCLRCKAGELDRKLCYLHY